MRKPLFQLAGLGLLTSLLFMGCPWSKSPNVFEGAKGISMPSFGGPPKQSEPPILDGPQSSAPRQTGFDAP